MVTNFTFFVYTGVSQVLQYFGNMRLNLAFAKMVKATNHNGLRCQAYLILSEFSLDLPK